MYPFIVSILLYMFPPKVVAKMLIVIFKRLAENTRWTKVDDTLVKIVEKSLTEEVKDDGQGG